MKTATNLKVVHESEVQRQHARLPVPASVRIENRKYAVKNLSSGGISIQGIIGDFTKGQPVRMALSVPLGGFSLEININGEVRYFDPRERVLGCNFTNLTAQQISFVNHVLKAFMAGDVVGAGDVLNVAVRNNFTKPRNKDVTLDEPSLVRQIPGLAVVAMVGLLIAFFVGGNLYDNLFVIKSANAAVAGPITDIKADLEGIYHSEIDPGSPTVTQGQVLGRIMPPSGRSVGVTSPCNCYIVRTSAAEGQPVSAGSALLSLIPVDAKPWVMAEVDTARGARMDTSTPAVIRVFGSKVQYRAHIASVESEIGKADLDQDKPRIMLRLVPDEKLPIDLAGRPAVVSFELMELPKVRLPTFDFSSLDFPPIQIPTPDVSGWWHKLNFGEYFNRV